MPPSNKSASSSYNANIDDRASDISSTIADEDLEPDLDNLTDLPHYERFTVRLDEDLYPKEKGRFWRKCIARTRNGEECEYKSTTITNIRSHLERKHNLVTRGAESSIRTRGIDIVLSFMNRTKATLSEDDRATRTQVEHALFVAQALVEAKENGDDWEKWLPRKALNAWFVRARIPPTAVEYPEFLAWCNTMNAPLTAQPGAIPTSHNTVRTDTLRAWKEEKAKMKIELRTETIGKIHVAVDVWTSPNRLLLLGITAHYLVRRSKLHQKALLGLREIEGHSGLYQYEAFRTVIEDYGIFDLLGTLIGDNATTNDTFVDHIQSYMDQEFRTEWLPQEQRLRCLGHILNLIAQAFIYAIKQAPSEDDFASYDSADAVQEAELERLIVRTRKAKVRRMGPLGKAHNIVIHIMSSPHHIKIWFKILNQELRPKMDNRTRWNSWFMMADFLLNHEHAVDLYVQKHSELVEDALSRDEWDSLRTTVNFLQVFKQYTKENEKDQANLGHTLPTMYAIKAHLERHIKIIPKTVRTTLSFSIFKLIFYIDDTWERASYEAYSSFTGLEEVVGAPLGSSYVHYCNYLAS
jgi:hypothetical protein